LVVRAQKCPSFTGWTQNKDWKANMGPFGVVLALFRGCGPVLISCAWVG